MILTLIPRRADDTLTLARAGDTLIVNGEAFDFTRLPEGAVLPRAAVAADWLASDVTRHGGSLRLAVFLPHGPIPFPPPPEAAVVTHPAPVEVWQDGPVELPVWQAPAEEVSE